MALLARRARKAVMAKAPAPLLQKRGGGAAAELAIPAHFRCPISLDLMRDPVTAPTGITYDREGIEAWLDTGRAVCPVTHAPLRHEDLVPNHAIRRVIQDWCVANRSRGVERIPTPKIPVTPVQASELLFDVAESAARRGAAGRAAGAVARVRALARDSERNRRCFVSVGTGRVLAAAFESLAAAGEAGVLEDVLAALVCMMPLDEEAARMGRGGVERIPMPKIPSTPVQASDSELLTAVRRRRVGAAERAAGAVARVRALARDSERNRRCFVSVGTGRVLAAAFESLAAAGEAGVLEDVLAALVCMMPLDEEAARVLASSSSMGSLVAIAKHGSLAGRLNAVLAIKEAVSRDGAFVDLADDMVDEVVDALVVIIKAPICPQATKAAMVATYHLASSDERVAARVASTGLVPTLIEALVDADKSVSEKALAVLDAMLASEEGRASARGHALAMPALVKKMFRVSDVATELAVSAMWRLGCKASSGDEEAAATGCLVEALRVGAFQKLLLLLQVGCRDATKEKATELLKMLNKHKGLGECVDAVDFRGLNRLS
uniref:U-box domain-containing protein n=1 Tax=Oryza meridionalis TaxID=40149 RepID=A0A0E0CXS0_9ORYZ